MAWRLWFVFKHFRYMKKLTEHHISSFCEMSSGFVCVCVCVCISALCFLLTVQQSDSILSAICLPPGLLAAFRQNWLHTSATTFRVCVNVCVHSFARVISCSYMVLHRFLMDGCHRL